MELKTTGYYSEMPHAQEGAPSMKEYLNKEEPEMVEAICRYLREGTVLGVSPGETTDVIEPEKGFSGTATAYTDGKWVWPGDLVYYVETYLLKIPDEFLQTMIENGWENPIKDMDFSQETIVVNGIRLF